MSAVLQPIVADGVEVTREVPGQDTLLTPVADTVNVRTVMFAVVVAVVFTV